MESSKRMSTARAKPLDQRFQQFKLARTGASGDCPRLVDYILLAEFDIDTGSTLRHKYPGPVPGYRDDWFAEYMLPEGAHNHSLDWTVMFLNKASRRAALADEGDGEAGGADPAPPAAGADGTAAAAAKPEPFLYCINLVRKKDDPTVRRGAVVKAMAVCSRHHFIEMFRPLLIIALDAYYQSTDPAVLAGLYAAINAADAAALPRPLAWERRVMRRGVAGRALGGVAQQHLPQKWTHTMTFEYGTQKVHTAIPLHSTPDETLTPSVTLLFTVFGAAAMRIYNAVITGQRVLFVGYNHAAGDVGKLVLAACAMVAPPLRGIVRRTFPYANLSDLAFLETPAYIAGVTNPMFESHTSWWDLLCQLDLPNGTGTALTADEKAALDDQKGKKSPPRPPARVSAEQLTCEDDAAFAARLLAGISAGMSEQWVRATLRDHTQGLVDLAVDQDTGLLAPQVSLAAAAAAAAAADGPLDVGLAPMSPNTLPQSATKSHPSNKWRLRELKQLPDFPGPQTTDPWRYMELAGGVSGAQLRRHVRRLTLADGGGLDDQEVKEIFRDLDTALQSEASLQVLLGLMPESKGGIFVLGCGLMHGSAEVRAHALSLHRRLNAFESTRPAIYAMNDLLAMTYMRNE